MEDVGTKAIRDALGTIPEEKGMDYRTVMSLNEMKIHMPIVRHNGNGNHIGSKVDR